MALQNTSSDSFVEEHFEYLSKTARDPTKIFKKSKTANDLHQVHNFKAKKRWFPHL